MISYLTDSERLKIATRTRAWGSRLERDMARAMAAKAMATPNATGYLLVIDTDVPLETRLRRWIPLDISGVYGNADMRCGMMMLRACGFLTDTHDGTYWRARLTPLMVAGIDGAFCAKEAA